VRVALFARRTPAFSSFSYVLTVRDGASPIRHRLASPQEYELWLTSRSARSGISSLHSGEGWEQRMGLESEATYAGV
jgi:hypothetical protein